MAAWTERPGFPLITVVSEKKLVGAGTLHGFEIKLRKRRYFSSPTEQGRQDSTYLPVWLCICYRGGFISQCFYGEEISVRLEKTDYYKINRNHTGFYRTTYPQPTLERFTLKSIAEKLSVLDKAGIVADATALCFSGHQSTTGLLDLLLKMKEEPD